MKAITKWLIVLVAMIPLVLAFGGVWLTAAVVSYLLGFDHKFAFVLLMAFCLVIPDCKPYLNWVNRLVGDDNVS